MELTINIENRKTYNTIVQFLKSLNVEIRSKTKNNSDEIPESGFASKKEFWSMFGIGKKQPLTLEEARKRAWKKR